VPDLSVGFIGAGAVTDHHLKVIGGREDVAVAAICDLDATRAGAVAEAVGARAYVDWRTMLGSEPLDALFVCTPPESHAEPAVEVIGRGLPVYVEKPLARTLADGVRIAEAWEAGESVCAVGYQWRSLDLLSELRASLSGSIPGMLISRSIGPTERARGDLAAARAGATDAWFADPRRSGGILFELGSHDIDLQLAIAGPVESVQAAAGSGRLALAGQAGTELKDSVAAILHFSSGALGTIHVAWTAAQDPPLYVLDVLAADAALHLELDPVFELRGASGGAAVAASGSTHPRVSTLTSFFDAVRRGDRGAAACSPADGLGTLRVALGCEQAIATGETVAVADLD
jgi:myo-inositol 2-dehydrogenase/D-chiro-inositol 1-dehydrogenase